MSTTPYQFYLAKDGQQVGPFTPEEFATLRDRGELQQYTALFDSRTGQWAPLAPPPPAVEVKTVPAPRTTEPEAVLAVANRRSANATAVRALEAVCHNYRDVVAGHLDRVNDQGCELVAQQAGASPCFADRGKVVLNLLDPRTGESMDVEAQLTSVTHGQKGWVYRLEWSACPEIVFA